MLFDAQKNRKGLFKKSRTIKIPLVTPVIHSDKEVALYQQELAKRLTLLGIDDFYFSRYLCTTYGRNTDLILEKFPDIKANSLEEQLIRSELWYCMHFEMVNSLSDFFVRRTARLYFDIESVTQFKKVILQDFSSYLGWSKTRIEEEQKTMDDLIQDATHYYDQEFQKVEK